MDKPTACAVCGATFQPVYVHRWGWSTTCSRKCSKKRNVQRAKANRPPNRECEHCGKAFYASTAPSTTTSGRGRFCGQPCFIQATRPKRTQVSVRWRRAQAKAARAANGTAGHRRWVAGNCVSCNRPFVDHRSTGGPAPLYCSPRCSRAAAGSRRRARLANQRPHGAPVYRVRVFKRDDWVCHLCGLPTKRSAAKTVGGPAPDPLAPTLDHVVPLAKGGEHSMDNARCAHFICNARKGDRLTPSNHAA